ncbi:hypothetical protein CEXT_207761 [Caerostris extrusa]|uniref:Uncharacterized protein n=1 Tax=Caerostris extrusa TaxID=172846 RepID=A0AAV4Q114_CAEEX|nr:hypothetical protein CEXT_207761 [Caerostris extrusa]
MRRVTRGGIGTTPSLCDLNFPRGWNLQQNFLRLSSNPRYGPTGLQIYHVYPQVATRTCGLIPFSRLVTETFQPTRKGA